MRRGGTLKAGKKTLAKLEAMLTAKNVYFRAKGWDNGDGIMWAPCQYCGGPMTLPEAHPHHKTPRSELRKAGILDLDAPSRLLMVHPDCHGHIHGWAMGRPKNEAAALEFAFVESHPANAENGKGIERLP